MNHPGTRLWTAIRNVIRHAGIAASQDLIARNPGISFLLMKLGTFTEFILAFKPLPVVAYRGCLDT